MANLLLIEDHEEVREELHAFLLMKGHTVTSTGSLEGFRSLIECAQTIDVAVIDLVLPDGEGHDAVAALRNQSQRTGIILLTASSDMSNRLKGLRDGADHYLVKPFSLLELTAIIDALLRRVGTEWLLDATTNQLRSPCGSALELNGFERGLFELLCNSKGNPLDRATLVRSMGFDWVSYDLGRLDTAISRLRTKWRNIANNELPLQTLHRNGYCFTESLRKSD